MRTFEQTLMWIVLTGLVALVSACDAGTGQSGESRASETEAGSAETADAGDAEFADEALKPHTGVVDASVAEEIGPGAHIKAAIAILHPTRGHDVHGTVRFKSTAGAGLIVYADISGLSHGMHAYHVHVYGDCSAPDASSAGPHFAFRADAREEPGKPERIFGNLGEIPAEPDGSVSISTMVQHARLNGPRSIIGRAVIVHAKDNNLSKPPGGAAGARVACGVIGIANTDYH